MRETREKNNIQHFMHRGSSSPVQTLNTNTTVVTAVQQMIFFYCLHLSQCSAYFLQLCLWVRSILFCDFSGNKLEREYQHTIATTSTSCRDIKKCHASKKMKCLGEEYTDGVLLNIFFAEKMNMLVE